LHQAERNYHWRSINHNGNATVMSNNAATRREREAVIRHLVARPRYLPVDSPRSSIHPLDRNR